MNHQAPHAQDEPSRLQTFRTGANDGEAGYIQDVSKDVFEFHLFFGPFGMSRPVKSRHLLLSHAETEGKLIKREETVPVKRNGNPLVRIHRNNLPSQGEGEDRLSMDVITRSNALMLRRGLDRSLWDLWADYKSGWTASSSSIEQGDRDLVLLSVIDGHGGSPAIADLAMKTFNACLAWAISDIFAGKPQYVTWSEELEAMYGQKRHEKLDAVQKAMVDAIVKVYKAWDHDVLRTPLHMLDNLIKAPSNPVLPDFPHPALVRMSDSVVPGAAIVNALVDVGGGTVYISHMGDVRAVAGWYDILEDKWRCDVLTNDHRGDDPVEAARMRAMHPPEEADAVMLDQGHQTRVLGSKEPTRALGAGTYTLPVGDSERLERVLGVKRQATDRPVRTPPYKVPYPDVTIRNLRPQKGEELRFIILATDGLWARLTSEEAALLVVAHLKHPHHDPIPKADLPGFFPHHPPRIPRPYPAQPVPGSRGTTDGEWVFMDDNVVTHLIRNSLGSRGWCAETRRRVLSMDNGYVKFQRDDTSAIVAFFDHNA